MCCVIPCPQLKDLDPGMSPSCVVFNRCTFHSEHFIAIRNEVTGDEDSSQLVVIDPCEKTVVIGQQTYAESIVMHPHQSIAALRSEWSRVVDCTSARMHWSCLYMHELTPHMSPRVHRWSGHSAVRSAQQCGDQELPHAGGRAVLAVGVGHVCRCCDEHCCVPLVVPRRRPW